MEPLWLWLRARWETIQGLVSDDQAKPKGAHSPDGGDQTRPRWKRALKWLGLTLLALIGLVVLITLSVVLFGGEEEPQRQATNQWGMPTGSMESMGGNPMGGLTTLSLMAGLMIGGGVVLLIAFWRWFLEKYGWLILLGVCGLILLIGETSGSVATSSFTSGLGFFIGLFAGAALAGRLFVTVTPATALPNTFGSSRWATRDDLEQWGLFGQMEDGDGLFLGEEKEDGTPIIYRGDMHALTVAPTRTGKGATAIIPNLLRSTGSVLVIDPKGENARRTATRRAEMGQSIHIVDPWAIAGEPDRFGPGAPDEYLAAFNPLDALSADDPDLGSDVMLLADALVVPSGKEPFWSQEAKALIAGVILYVVTEPKEAEHRNLGRVRDILCLPPAANLDADSLDEDALEGTMQGILLRMAASDHLLVKQAAFRYVQKEERERSGVLSTAQSNTHFLDSPKIRASLEHSSFRFRDLKTGDKPSTIYLVLPLDRLPTFNRWLRLLITSAMTDLTRTPAKPGAEPVRIILDEFAALQKLSLIETAFGTMAGLGVQLWVVTQDLTQLMRLYGDKGWQTFVSNAGVFQYFGSRDHETAHYAERLTGMTTMRKRSVNFGTSTSLQKSWRNNSTSQGHSETVSYDDVQRPLAYADQLMTLHRDLQLLFVENRYPIIAKKYWWFKAQLLAK